MNMQLDGTLSKIKGVGSGFAFSLVIFRLASIADKKNHPVFRVYYYTERTSSIRSAAKSSSICARSLRGAGWQIIERDCKARGASGAKRKNFHPPAANLGLLVPTE